MVSRIIKIKNGNANRLQHMNKLLAISIASASIAIGVIPASAGVDAKTH